MKKIKFSGFGRRQVTLVSLVILIAVAGYINLTHKEEEAVPASGDIEIQESLPENSPAPSADDYFSVSRLERDKARSAAMEVHKEIIDSNESSAKAKEEAQKELAAYAKAMETEAALEGLIKAKGFEEALVYIAGQNANVVVKTIGLTPAQAAQIKDLVIQNAKIGADKIKIIEIN